jgi:hypothetical protein
VLRQLARLTRPVAGAPGACALAVYADELDRHIPARESGEEGVACVDDAARGLGLFCDLWAATKAPRARARARELLEFVLWMQLPDGRFVNFIHDWSGRHNELGLTSVAGGAFWQARGLSGLASAWLDLGDERAADGFRRALALVRRAPAPPDVRAVQISAVLGVLRSGRCLDVREDLARWCEELASARRGDVLVNDLGADTVHLWGHLQEAVLADAGRLLGRPELVEAARRSAEAVFVPAIESAFALPLVQPYAVSCAILAMDALQTVTGDARYRRLAADARAWFDGRNPAGIAVYDRERGRVGDGIDGGRVSTHSGAESNLVAAQALFTEVAAGLEIVA